MEKAVAWGVVGSRRRLDAAVLDDADVRELLDALRDRPAARRQLVTRIGQLASMGGSPEYLHRYDLAIFAYLRALDILDPDLAAVAAPGVAALGNVRWSRPLALRLGTPSHTSSRAADSSSKTADTNTSHGAPSDGDTKCSPDVDGSSDGNACPPRGLEHPLVSPTSAGRCWSSRFRAWTLLRRVGQHLGRAWIRRVGYRSKSREWDRPARSRS